MKIQNVAVIGAGRMGRLFTALLASAGYATVLEDIMPSNLRKAAEQLSGLTVPGGDEFEMAPGTVRFASSVEDAVRTADLVLDCVPDELESKLEIFSMLDRMAPPLTIFVTPTRNVSIADLASCTYRPDRCIALKFGSAELLRGKTLVLVSTSLTSPEVLAAVVSVWQAAGFVIDLENDSAEASVSAGTLF